MLHFIHLTDCHLLDSVTETILGVNAFENLSRIVKDIKDRQPAYDFVLATGDISQSGTEKSYALFKKAMERLNKPVYCLPGNHDNPTLLKHVFTSSPDKSITINPVNNHLLILLNSHYANHQSGEVSTDQLVELKTALQQNSTRPVIIGVHHPPINIRTPWLDNIGLTNGRELCALTEKYPLVKLILFGHAHQTVDNSYNQMKIVGTPSTSYQFKPQTKTMQLDDLAPGYRTVKLMDNGLIQTQVHRVGNA